MRERCTRWVRLGACGLACLLAGCLAAQTAPAPHEVNLRFVPPAESAAARPAIEIPPGTVRMASNEPTRPDLELLPEPSLPPPPAPVADLAAPPAPTIDIVPVGCSGCASGLLSASLGPPPDLPAAKGLGPPSLKTPMELPGCGCAEGAPCVPGRKTCHPCEAEGWVGRFFCALYDCICCPDPCYEGRWYPLADSAMFCDAVRPITQTRLRWDSGPGFLYPDRSEYFWAQANGRGRGPRPTSPLLATPSLRYNDLLLSTEGGTGRITMTTDMPYREVQAEPYFHGAGFSDMSIMTKTLLFDCELIQFAILFRTWIPIGNVTKGVGNGHVTLEPGGVVGIKLTPTTYLQGQMMQWIPIGGDPEYAGGVLHYHASLNQVLWRVMPDVPLIGTMEFAGYSFQDGKYTDPFLGAYQKSSGYTYFYAGGGARLFVCDKIDFGFGALFALTDQHFSRELYRTEFRVRW